MDLPYNLDFLPIYAQSLALCSGAPLYEVDIQRSILLARAGISFAADLPYPPPYPPWSIMLYAPICTIAPQPAANLFFAINMFFYVVAILLCTFNCSTLKRAILIMVAASLPTTIGLLTVGQMTMPILLGLACCYFALHKQKPWLLSIGLSLFTFKPLLGVFCIAFFIGYFSATKPLLIKSCFMPLITIWAMLLTLSFLIEPGWPITFTRASFEMSRAGINLNCDTCSSLTINILRLAGIYEWVMKTASLPIVIATLMIATLIGHRSKLLSPNQLVIIAACLALLSPVYIRNYDYSLLAIPLLLVFANKPQRKDIILAAGALVLTWLIAFSSREFQGLTLWIPAMLLALTVLPNRTDIRRNTLIIANQPHSPPSN